MGLIVRTLLTDENSSFIVKATNDGSDCIDCQRLKQKWRLI